MANPWEKYQQQGPGIDPRIANEVEASRYDAPIAANKAAASAYDDDLARATLAQKANADQIARERLELDRQKETNAQNKPLITAKERADAIRGYQSAETLDKLIQDLEVKFQEGPGSTSGLGGVIDYFPTPSNERFDKAANSMRGTMGDVLGFTGGQLNSAAEAQMNIGSFIPESGNYDETILDTIGRLKDQRDSARSRAIAILGGVPDANGNVTPLQSESQTVPQRQIDKTQQRMVGGANPAVAPTQGQYETVDNPALAGLNNEVMSMLLGGQDAAAIAEHIKSRGVNPIPMMGAIQQNVEIQKTNPGVRPQINLDDMQRELSPEQQVLSNAADSGFGAYGVASANALSAGMLDEIAGGNAQQTKEYLRSQYPGATLGGDITGGVAAMLPAGRGVQAGAKALGAAGLGNNAVKAGLLGDVAYGTALGAGENNDNRLMGAAIGAGAAGVGNKLGTGAARTLGRGVRGVQDQTVQTLNSAGVPLSLGQMLGNRSLGGRFMNKMESTPVIGDMMNTRRTEANEAVFNAALGDAVAPAGATLPKGAGIAEAQAAKNQAYTDALQGVNVSPDAQFADDMLAANQVGTQSRRFADDYTDIVAQDFPDVAGTGPVNGQQLQDMLRQSAALKNTYGKKVYGGADPQPTARAPERAFGMVEDALTNLTNRQQPGVIPALKNANAVNARLAPIEQAMMTANGKVPTPLQMRRKMTTNTKKFGGQAAAARGDKVPGVVDAGADVLPSTVPNSGTADRLAALALPATLGGGAIGVETLTDNPALSGTLGALALLSTKRGAALTQKAAIDRPEVMQRLGDQIIKNRRLGGIFGAPAMLSLAPR